MYEVFMFLSNLHSKWGWDQGVADAFEKLAGCCR